MSRRSGSTPVRRLRRGMITTSVALASALTMVACSSSSTPTPAAGTSAAPAAGASAVPTGSSSSAPATSGGGASNSAAAPNGSGGAAVNIDFWTWVPNPQNAVDAFNKSHPSIHVNLLEIPGGAQGGNAKLFAALKAGNAPCTAQVQYQDIPDYLVANGLLDISKYVAGDKSKFVEWQWNQGVYGDKTYTIPQASGPMALYYRADMFTAAGITTAPKTWDEYAADAALIQKKYPKSFISTSPTSYGNYLAAVAEQAGATWFSHTADTWNVNISGANTKKVTDYWTGLIKKGLVKNENPFGTGFNSDLAGNVFAAYVGASWTDALIRAAAPDQSGKWKVAPLPQWTAGGTGGGNWGGSSTGVLADCKYPQQAAEFAVWLNSDPTSVSLLNDDGYGWPAVTDPSQIASIKNSAVTQKYYAGQNINEVFAAADKLTNKNWTSVPTASQVYSNLTTALAGAADPGAVLDQEQSTTTANLTKQGLKVSTN